MQKAWVGYPSSEPERGAYHNVKTTFEQLQRIGHLGMELQILPSHQTRIILSIPRYSPVI